MMDKKNIKNNSLTGSRTDNVSLGEIFSKVAFHWPLYVLVIGFSIFAAFIYLRYTKPMYSSTAKIYIKDDKKGGSDLTALRDLTGYSDNKVVENEMEMLKSPLILNDVIREYKFNVRYFYNGRVSQNELYKTSPVRINILTDSSQVGSYNFKVNIENNQRLKVSYSDREVKGKIHSFSVNNNQPFIVSKDKFSLTYFPELYRDYYKGFNIVIDSIGLLGYRKAKEIVISLSTKQSTVLLIKYDDRVPERSADFLNCLLKTYNLYTLNDKNRTTLSTIQFIDTRLASLGNELNTLERDVENFKKNRGITEISENSRLYLDQAKEADQQLSQANIELSVFDNVEKYVNDANGNAPFAPVYGNVDPSLSSMISKYEDLLREKQRLSLSLKQNSPQQQNLDTQIEDAKKTIKNYTSGFRRNAITARAGLLRKVNKVEGLISNIPEYEREYINIKRQESVKEQLYLYLLQKKEESSVAYASNMIDNKVISPAYIPDVPVSPQRTLVYLVFVGAGIFLGTVYIILKYALNNKITSKGDIQNVTDLPIIAEIFEEVEAEKNQVVPNERSILKEQVLNLRNNLKFLLGNFAGSPVILFTSSISGEGKTFLSSHVGQSLTYNEKKVVMLELDLRKPKLSKSFGLSNAEGITNYLIGAQTLDQITKKVPNIDRLYIIPSGPTPPNPVELLESEKFKELITLLKQRFDFIIIDTSPIGLVSDAKSLSPYVDCALFVMRYNYTPKGKIVEVLSSFENHLFERVGVIFNGIKKDSSYSYYGYGYSSGYGYGYGMDSSNRNTVKSAIKGLASRF